MDSSSSSTLGTFFTKERAWQVLETIANTYAPGQTVAYTRAPQIIRLLNLFETSGFQFDRNYRSTGNSVLRVGRELPRIWFFAHADEISYLVGKQQADGTYPLTPFCAHKSQISAPAVVLRYSLKNSQLEVVGHGNIQPPTMDDSNPTLTLTEGHAQPGDRVVYAHQQTLHGDYVEGSIDNAAGVTACLLAAMALAKINTDLSVGFVFTDEEEGPSAQNTSFSRGARRFLRVFDFTGLSVVVDGHPVAGGDGLGMGALITEKSGDAAAAVTPPHLYAHLRLLVEQLREKGVRVTENTGRVSRGDEIALIETTPNTLLFGYPSRNRHFDTGPSSASLSDIIEVAKLIYWAALYFSENSINE